MLSDDVHRAAAALDEQRQDAPLVDAGSLGFERIVEPLGCGALGQRKKTQGLVVHHWARPGHGCDIDDCCPSERSNTNTWSVASVTVCRSASNRSISQCRR